MKHSLTLRKQGEELVSERLFSHAVYVSQEIYVNKKNTENINHIYWF